MKTFSLSREWNQCLLPCHAADIKKLQIFSKNLKINNKSIANLKN